MAEINRAFKGVWIPKELYCNNDLNWSEKILLVEIHSFCSGNMGCFAGNEHFARHLMLSKDRISKLISTLSKSGYLTTKMTYRKGTKQIEKREIFLTEKYYNMYLEGIGENNHRGIVENNHRGIGENAEDNNTSFSNNTSFNNTSTYIEPIGSTPLQCNADVTKPTKQIKKYSDDPELNDTIISFIKFRKDIKKPMNDHTIDLLIKKLEKMDPSIKNQIEILNQSMLNGWQGIFPLKEDVNKPQQKGRLDWLDDIR
jgi:hypothetical protein